jgi:hypothetical protein
MNAAINAETNGPQTTAVNWMKWNQSIKGRIPFIIGAHPPEFCGVADCDETVF